MDLSTSSSTRVTNFKKWSSFFGPSWGEKDLTYYSVIGCESRPTCTDNAYSQNHFVINILPRTFPARDKTTCLPEIKCIKLHVLA